MTQQTNGRRVVVAMNFSIDGHYAKPEANDMGWVLPYAVTDVARDHMISLFTPATTALLGRLNAEGFMGYWPTIIGTEGADSRDEAFAKWLVATDKVVLSSTLTDAPWERTSIVNKPTADAVDELKATEGGDIVVFNSASVIRALLAADKVDRLALMIFPIFLGAGPRLFEDGLPESQWKLTSQSSGEQGALALVYDRVRN
jgi:dihydrofolate reductase